jgi:hypothetical protein
MENNSKTITEYKLIKSTKNVNLHSRFAEGSNSSWSNTDKDVTVYNIDNNSDIYYIGAFPKDWALNHMDESGPENCENCYCYGSWNGIFIGYCVNCAEFIYNGKRGRGFTTNGVESEDNDKFISIFDTYLKGIDINLYDIEDSYEEVKKYTIFDIDDSDIYDNYIEDDSFGMYGTSTYGSNMNGGYNSY